MSNLKMSPCVKRNDNNTENREVTVDSAFDPMELDDSFLLELDVEINQHYKKGSRIEILESEKEMTEVKLEKLPEGGKDGDISMRSGKFSPDSRRNINDCQSGDPHKYHSPVFKLWNSKDKLFSSSTPLRKKVKVGGSGLQEEYNVQATQNVGNLNKINEYIDFDLFEDWDNYTVKKDNDKQKPSSSQSFITLSQAFDIIEEAKKELQSGSTIKQSEDMHSSTESIDLLTGKTIKGKSEVTENPFSESFDLSKIESFERKLHCIVSDSMGKVPSDSKKKIFGNDESIILDFGDDFDYFGGKDNDAKSKTKVAQKLNFEETENAKDSNIKSNKQEGLDSTFQNSFWDKSQSKENKIDEVSNYSEGKKNCLRNSDKDISSNAFNMTLEYTDDSLCIGKKSGKVLRVEESDNEEDSFRSNEPVRRKNTKRSTLKFARGLLDIEAEDSDENEDKSGDEHFEDEYEESFVDDGSPTSGDESHMKAKYLESIKMTNNRPGTFKIPKLKPYIIEDIFSQVPQENNSDYETNSFCVSDVEYENSELCDLEIAEQILEFERKKKKQERKKQMKKN